MPGLPKRRGRPPGTPNIRHQITAGDVARLNPSAADAGDSYLPVDYMLAIMRDERAEASRRDMMAIQAAPFCHPRLNAVATTNAGAQAGGISGDVNIVQIFAVPRGAAFDVKSGTVTIDGDVTQAATVEPYEGTPPMRDALETAPKNSGGLVPVVRAEPLPVITIDTANVTRLDAYRDGRDD